MIVRETSTIKAHTGINKNLSWDTILPFCRQAEEKYAKTMLSSGQYAHLVDAIDNNSLTAIEMKLLDYLIPMIANFCMYIAAPQINVHISDLGFQELSSKEGTSHTASMIRYNDARLSFWRTADNYRELAYQFLQENIASFPLWESSDACSIFNQLLIRSGSELNAFLGYGSAVSTYNSLRASIIEVEHFFVVPVIGDTFLEHLKAQRKSNLLTPEEILLLDKLLPSVAWLALGMAATGLVAVLEDGNLVSALPPEQSKIFSPLNERQLAAIEINAKQKGERFLNQFKLFLDQNASTYPVYFNSTFYKIRNEDYNLPNNRNKSSFRL